MSLLVTIKITTFNHLMKVKIGDSAPNFVLPTQSGNDFSLKNEIGKHHILLYFYPKDNTPGCITEACTFRDNYHEFRDLNCIIVGISKDRGSSHRGFIERYNLPFELLSDPQNKVRKLYGVKPVIPGILPGRKTFLVNTEGVVTHIFEYQFKPVRHVEEALFALKNG